MNSTVFRSEGNAHFHRTRTWSPEYKVIAQHALCAAAMAPSVEDALDTATEALRRVADQTLVKAPSAGKFLATYHLSSGLDMLNTSSRYFNLISATLSQIRGSYPEDTEVSLACGLAEQRVGYGMEMCAYYAQTFEQARAADNRLAIDLIDAFDTCETEFRVTHAALRLISELLPKPNASPGAISVIENALSIIATHRKKMVFVPDRAQGISPNDLAPGARITTQVA